MRELDGVCAGDLAEGSGARLIAAFDSLRVSRVDVAENSQIGGYQFPRWLALTQIKRKTNDLPASILFAGRC